ncbi:unnamed protein product [Effrenium voratum]|uniref:Peptidase S54 rhomboid domain-containing protein n=1 Tax=Effrenium voratum TaxID=2562239 RepID=A0AA36HWV0_9DINO|nr:unnamed protein product [Effrenium voratum]|mmetsp:Transcript_85401/g.204645  ORF Transcript_85401/g.204645 Transcript_85401/m.204645 type:complete len:289 (-) Transcript_85401:136-1002(-)
MGAALDCAPAPKREQAAPSRPQKLQRASTRCALLGSALAVAGVATGTETELAAVALIVLSLGLEALAAFLRHRDGLACWPMLQRREGKAQKRDKDDLLSCLRVFGPAVLAMAIFTAWGSGAVRRLGIVPRTWEGLPGVFFGCFVHFSWPHCIWNAVALALLAPCVLGAGVGNLPAASAFIALSSGFCVWCMARPALHAGASGVVCGYLGLLMALVLRRRDVPLGTLLMVLGVVVCYGGALLLHSPGLSLPLYEACTSRSTSAEHHTFGFLSGLASALLFVQPRHNVGR